MFEELLCLTCLNPFGVREVSKPTLVFNYRMAKCLNPFGVREVSKPQGHLKLSRLERLNPFGVREVSKRVANNLLAALPQSKSLWSQGSF